MRAFKSIVFLFTVCCMLFYCNDTIAQSDGISVTSLEGLIECYEKEDLVIRVSNHEIDDVKAILDLPDDYSFIISESDITAQQVTGGVTQQVTFTFTEGTGNKFTFDFGGLNLTSSDELLVTVPVGVSCLSGASNNTNEDLLINTLTIEGTSQRFVDNSENYGIKFPVVKFTKGGGNQKILNFYTTKKDPYTEVLTVNNSADYPAKTVNFELNVVPNGNGISFNNEVEISKVRLIAGNQVLEEGVDYSATKSGLNWVFDFKETVWNLLYGGNDFPAGASFDIEVDYVVNNDFDRFDDHQVFTNYYLSVGCSETSCNTKLVSRVLQFNITDGIFDLEIVEGTPVKSGLCSADSASVDFYLINKTEDESIKYVKLNELLVDRQFVYLSYLVGGKASIELKGSYNSNFKKLDLNKDYFSETIYVNSSKNYIDFPEITEDIDGIKGIQDLNGDNKFQELARGDTIYFRVKYPINCFNDDDVNTWNNRRYYIKNSISIETGAKSSTVEELTSSDLIISNYDNFHISGDITNNIDTTKNIVNFLVSLPDNSSRLSGKTFNDCSISSNYKYKLELTNLPDPIFTFNGGEIIPIYSEGSDLPYLKQINGVYWIYGLSPDETIDIEASFLCNENRNRRTVKATLYKECEENCECYYPITSRSDYADCSSDSYCTIKANTGSIERSSIDFEPDNDGLYKEMELPFVNKPDAPSFESYLIGDTLRVTVDGEFSADICTQEYTSLYFNITGSNTTILNSGGVFLLNEEEFPIQENAFSPISNGKEVELPLNGAKVSKGDHWSVTVDLVINEPIVFSYKNQYQYYSVNSYFKAVNSAGSTLTGQSKSVISENIRNRYYYALNTSILEQQQYSCWTVGSLGLKTNTTPYFNNEVRPSFSIDSVIVDFPKGLIFDQENVIIKMQYQNNANEYQQKNINDIKFLKEEGERVYYTLYINDFFLLNYNSKFGIEVPLKLSCLYTSNTANVGYQVIGSNYLTGKQVKIDKQYLPYTFVTPNHNLVGTELSGEARQEVEEWSFKVAKLSKNSTRYKNIWIAFEESQENKGNIEFDSVKISGESYTVHEYSGGIFVNIPGDKYKSDTTIVDFFTSLNSCAPKGFDNFIVTVGWSCDSTQVLTEDMRCQSIDDINFTLGYSNAAFQSLTVLDHTGSPAPQNLSIDICDTLFYEVEMVKGGDGAMYDPEILLVKNSGLLIDSARIVYNGQSHLYLAEDIVNGSVRLADKFLGINEEGLADADVIKGYFHLSSTCGFDASQPIKFVGKGRTYCGSDAIAVGKEIQINIDGLNSQDKLAVGVSGASSGIKNKPGSVSKMSVEISRNFAEPAWGDVSSHLGILLPAGIKIVPGSVEIVSGDLPDNYEIDEGFETSEYIVFNGYFWRNIAWPPGAGSLTLEFDVQDHGILQSDPSQIPVFTGIWATDSAYCSATGAYCSVDYNVDRSLISIPVVEPPVLPCEECISSFSPVPDKEYVVSAWIKAEQKGVVNYSDVSVNIAFRGSDKIYECLPTGEIIDGWQRIEKVVRIPVSASAVEVRLVNKSDSPAYFDDIRLHPFNSNMKSFVYDPESLRLVAELDENNYATFYEYDEEGALIRIKKETERGVKTIQESRNNSTKKQAFTP